MNKFSQSTEDIKRLIIANIAENKTARIRRILPIGFDDFSFGDYFFNLIERNASTITASLAMSSNSIFLFIKFLPNLFNHNFFLVTFCG